MNSPTKAGSSDWLRRLLFLVQALILLSTCALSIHAQGSLNRSSIRDSVRSIEQKEMDQKLLLAPLPAKNNSDPARLIALRQIREDFRDLQALNNKMMGEAWARETLDYGFVSDMVSRIRGKATRLKINLNLPDPGNLKEDSLDQNIANTNDFRAALTTLDRTIMSFVSNPLFQRPNTFEVNQATKARQDLESVIDLTADLKKLASSLAKTSKSK